MLTAIRERATGWIAWAIVILITIPFALWGVNSYFEGLGTVIVAEVNGEEIDYDEYNNARSQQRRYYEQSFGGQLGSEFFSSEQFKTQTIESLVQDRLINQQIEEQGYRISDTQLLGQIQSAPQFQDENGKFDKFRYERLLASNRLSPQMFEAQERRRNEAAQIRNGVASSAFVIPARKENLLKLVSRKRKASFVVVQANQFEDDIVVEADEIKAKYDENPDAYRAPERVKVEYLQLSVDDLASEIEVSDDDVSAIYEQNRDDYGAPERRKARHILINVPRDDEAAGDSAETDDDKIAEAQELDAAAKEKAQSIRERLVGGENFEEIAKAESEDVGSAAKGGDLGFVSKGTMVKPFEDALFAMSVDEISEPIKSQYGYHIIQMTELEAERIKSLDEMKEEIKAAEQRTRAESRFIDLNEIMSNFVYEQPDTLGPAADELGIEVQESEWISRDNGTGVAQHPDVRAAAFSNEILNEGLNSDVIEIDQDTLVAIRKLDHEPSSVKPFDEVKEDIEAELKNEKAAAKAIEAGKELLKTVQEADDPATELANQAEALEASLVTLPESREAAQQANFQVASAVFSAALPENGPRVDGVELSGGDYAVYVLSEILDGSVDDLEEEVTTRFESTLNQRLGQEIFAEYQSHIRSQADVSIRLDQIAEGDQNVQGSY